MKLAIVVSHPIQHFCPQYASIARCKGVTLKVYFASALGAKKYYDPNFKKEISWPRLHLDQFDHVFLNGDNVIPSTPNLDAPSLESQLDSFSPDVVITYGYIQKLQRRAGRWAVRNRVKLAYISDSELRQRRSAFKAFFKMLFLRYYFRKVDFFLTVGDANESFYLAHAVDPRRFIRMHFPIDVEYYKTCFLKYTELRVQSRQKFKIPENEIVLAMVGKLVPWKNQTDLVRAIALLESQQIYLTALIVGSGETAGEIVALTNSLTRSRVVMAGFVGPDELPAIYAAADIYVHSASVEPHSIAISEACFMGLPIVLSDRCGSHGPTDDVQPGRNGFVFEFGNINELARCIRELISADDKRFSFAEHSKRISREFQEIAHGKFIDKLMALVNS